MTDTSPTAERTTRPSYWFTPETARAFVGRDRELEALRRLWNGGAPRTPLLLIHGEGGVGKTTLLNRFMHDLDRSPGAPGVFVYSFYLQREEEEEERNWPRDLDGPAVGRFLRKACEEFGLPAPERSTRGPVEDVLGYVRRHPTVMFLDGFELNQFDELDPQWPSATLVRFERLERFLYGFAADGGPSLCVVTTRFPIRKLRPPPGAGAAEVTFDALAWGAPPAGPVGPAALRLNGVPPATGADLIIQYAGGHPPGWTRDALEAVSKWVGGHALTLQLVGTYLSICSAHDAAQLLNALLRENPPRVPTADPAQPPGGPPRKADDERARIAGGPAAQLLNALLSDEADWDGHANRVCARYKDWFTEHSPAWRALCLVSYFDSEPNPDELDFLRRADDLFPDGPSLADKGVWERALNRLRAAHLVFPPREGQRDPYALVDLHPIIRAYARVGLIESKAYQSGRQRLAGYALARARAVEPPKGPLTGSLDAPDRALLHARLRHYYTAMEHAAAAGDYADAFRTYLEVKGADPMPDTAWPSGPGAKAVFRTGRVSNSGAEVAALFALFNGRWDIPRAELAEHRDALLIAAAGLLRATGRDEEARLAEDTLGEVVGDGAPNPLDLYARINLCSLALTRGDFGAAKREAERISELVSVGKTPAARAVVERAHYAYLAAALHPVTPEERWGTEDDLAGLHFRTARERAAVAEPDGELSGTEGFWYCDYLLDLAEQGRGRTPGEGHRIAEWAAGRIARHERDGRFASVALYHVALARAKALQLAPATGPHPEAREGVRRHLDLAAEMLVDLEANHQLPHALIARAAFLITGPELDPTAEADLRRADEIASSGRLRRYEPDIQYWLAKLCCRRGDHAGAAKHLGRAEAATKELGYLARRGRIAALRRELSATAAPRPAEPEPAGVPTGD